MAVKINYLARQRAAAPHASAFVYANAGAGKTHLLVSRVLRLLLSGVEPSRILCITYTKAAAAEMRERIHRHLSEWVRLDEAALQKALAALTDTPPPPSAAARARSLFAMLTDAPEGLRIQTIHSFCQSLLKRFPLEAGMAPYFTVIDERTSRELLREAAMRLFSQSLSAAPELQEALRELSARMNETTFHDLLREIAAHRQRLQSALAGGRDAAAARLYALLGVKAEDTEQKLAEECFRYTPEQVEALRGILRKLRASAKPTDAALADPLEAWLAQDAPRAGAETYAARYYTQTGTPRQSLCTKEAKLEQAEKAALLAEQERAGEYMERCRALRMAVLSAHTLTVAEALLALYEAIKRARAAADYEDLIGAVTRLFGQEHIAPWVMYKLDGGIDHILIDEAQDTSREQWLIAKALTDEFFSGQGRREETRTMFAVGDVKQSIFSFQGARPELFAWMQAYYGKMAEQAGVEWAAVELPESFRSAAPVLEAVDRVFARAEAALGEGNEGGVKHLLTRAGEAGSVEIWPLAAADEAAAEGWRLPRERVRRDKPVHRLAALLAQRVRDWLDTGEILEAKGRPIAPGDIMILVRKRGEPVQAMMRELRVRGVPVAGADRLSLTKSLAVQDLLALAGFLLLPEDDLTLAGLLKCPLFEITEELLFQLAQGRGARTLWQRLQEMREAHPAFAQAHGRLAKWLDAADFIPPYELFAQVLEAGDGRSRFVARFGTAAHDVLDEFLAQALAFEHAHAPSLQGFAQWMAQGGVEIKRDMEKGGGEVRIMTVHAAKGLQAPVVIMPDTTSAPRSQERLLWHAGEEGGCLLWGAARDALPRAAREIRERQAQREAEEYRRLLYVAMTRAEDRLIVCGAESGKADAGCWHALVWGALSGAAEAVETPTGPGWTLRSPQTAAVERKEAPEPPPPGALPDALRHAPPPEEALTKPLSPSKLWEEEESAFSPVEETARYRRGALIHRLLQYVPGVAAEGRKAALRRMLARQPLQENEREALEKEVLALLSAPQFAPFFSRESLAEVPVAGTVRMQGKDYPVAGQIDRLTVGEDEVWLLDYKTGAPPAPGKAPPPRYLRQMAAYRALLCGVYPGRRVRCALLWTADLTLTELPEEALEALVQATPPPP